MLLLLRQCGERAVTGGDDRVAGECEDFFEVVAVLVLIGNQASAHRAGKHRVATDGERPRQAGDQIGCLPC